MIHLVAYTGPPLVATLFRYQQNIAKFGDKDSYFATFGTDMGLAKFVHYLKLFHISRKKAYGVFLYQQLSDPENVWY